MIEDQNAFDRLRCPQHGCDGEPYDDEIESIVDPKVFKKYKTFNLNKKVANDVNLTFCNRPGCPGVI